MSCDVIKTAFVIYCLKWKFSIVKYLDDIQSPRLILQSSLTTDSFENQIPSSRIFIRTFSWQEIRQQDSWNNIFTYNTKNKALWSKWVIFDEMIYQRLPEYQISFHLFKVSEPWKFEMCSFCVSTDEKHSLKQAIFSLFPNRMKKWVIFDAMAYQRHSEYQISFSLFKVSEPWKFQMSSFCVITDKTHSSKKAIFSLIPNRMEKMSHIWHNGIPKASRISN